jgi:serine/threonine protein kinase
LNYLHEKKIIHLGLNPSILKFVLLDSKRQLLKIADFDKSIFLETSMENGILDEI